MTWLVVNKSELFKDNYVSVEIYGSTDSIIVNEDCLDMLGEFCLCVTSHHGGWGARLDALYKHWRVKNDIWYYDDKALVRNIRCADPLSMLLIKEYFVIQVRVGSRGNQGLLVVGVEDFRFVGFISYRYESVSTAELSRLILTTPEINWTP